MNRSSRRKTGLLSTVMIALILILPPKIFAAAKIVIAKDGAGQQFIENTLIGLPLAVADRVEFIELRVLLTHDDQLIVFRDQTLNRLTDVAMRFPDRHREDGNFYVADFSLAEIRQLRLHNVFENGAQALSLPIPTLNETLNVINHLDKMNNRLTGLTIEPGYPKFYKDQGKDVSNVLLTVLIDSGVLQENRPVYLQSSDADELQRLKETLFTAHNIELPLIQLLRMTTENESGTANQLDYSWIFTNSGLRLVALYATFLGIPGQILINNDGAMPLTEFVKSAHVEGLKILATSLQATPGNADSNETSLTQKLDQLFNQVDVDGLFTDDFRSIQKYQQEKEEQVQPKNDLPPFFSTLHLARPKNDQPQQTDVDTQTKQPLRETGTQLELVEPN